MRCVRYGKSNLKKEQNIANVWFQFSNSFVIFLSEICLDIHFKCLFSLVFLGLITAIFFP